MCEIVDFSSKLFAELHLYSCIFELIVGLEEAKLAEAFENRQTLYAIQFKI